MLFNVLLREDVYIIQERDQASISKSRTFHLHLFLRQEKKIINVSQINNKA
jgi:hypothetical protein